MNPLFLIDFYKVGHVSQYPAGTQRVWSNWTPRSSRVPGQADIVHFGLSYFMQRFLKEAFDEGFFGRPVEVVLEEYRELISVTLGVAEPKTDHIAWLHSLGFLPLAIYSLPEGSSVPLGVPALVITNTLSEAFWLPNYLETILSNTLWKPSTSATTARTFRRIFEKYARLSGETDMFFTQIMGHDFSMRGMSSVEDAMLSGMGHLTSFLGTDTVPAIVAAKKYYGTGYGLSSVPATEHSVMCAGEKDGEFETFRRLIEDIYPSGVVSIVSDTWDLWTVLTDYVPRLKDKILARNGKVVIRPDSGDPELILCGDPMANGPAQKGVLRLLVEALGTTGKYINGAGAIYGDSITPERADRILNRVVNELGLSPYNCVFGIGSYAYQYVTRDTHNFAMKATAVMKNGVVVPIFKDPTTDNAHKKSCKGIPLVYKDEVGDGFHLVETCDPSLLDKCAFVKVYENGRILDHPNLEEIRKRVNP